MGVCAKCEGDGWYIGIEMEIHAEAGCCGDLTRHGECCGEPIPVPIEVPVQVQIQCDCGSTGPFEPYPSPTTGATTTEGSE